MNRSTRHFRKKAIHGYIFGTFGIEIHLRNYSNGDVTAVNHGPNFIGANILYNF
ncbi:MAG: hypothetical protein LBB13_03490 [Rickettsiales bacterium]|nr:hypothetical protein [Rickettsiales bacterium]